MKEVGIDMSAQKPKILTPEAVLGRDDHHGCGGTCPVMPGKQYLEWQPDDPAGQAWTPCGPSGIRSSSVCVVRSPPWRADVLSL
ncbi:hypothetical protein S1361_01270 [Streptomyces cyanogenus]|uniref:Uncharacterized protein n=2 Tax=Streptomyces cyanogenus TaxID=80860 RepID=A0ABX7THP8_STRCY|nr:hypothetical protein S1361_01270 [Streptomyces cyanogenus]